MSFLFFATKFPTYSVSNWCLLQAALLPIFQSASELSNHVRLGKVGDRVPPEILAIITPRANLGIPFSSTSWGYLDYFTLGEAQTFFPVISVFFSCLLASSRHAFAITLQILAVTQPNNLSFRLHARSSRDCNGSMPYSPRVQLEFRTVLRWIRWEQLFVFSMLTSDKCSGTCEIPLGFSPRKIYMIRMASPLFLRSPFHLPNGLWLRDTTTLGLVYASLENIHDTWQSWGFGYGASANPYPPTLVHTHSRWSF